MTRFSLRGVADAASRRAALRPEPEYDQAIVRLVVAGLVLAYTLVVLALAGASQRAAVFATVVAIAYFGIAVWLAADITSRPGEKHARRVFGVSVDTIANLACLGLLGAAGGLLVASLMVMVLSNGIRLGSRLLWLSLALAAAGFVSVGVLNEYWRAHWQLALGLFLGVALSSIYGMTHLARAIRARATSEAANLEKSRFLWTMSHEMRTPLNGVIGVNALLQDTPLTREQRDLLKSLSSSAQHLLALVNNVLDIAKIEAGELELESVAFDLPGLVHTTIRPFVLQARTKHLRTHVAIDLDVPSHVRGSPLHLRQVLVNLVGNAVKFTHQGRVFVHVSCSGGRVRFEVEDTGIGIHASARDRIFDRFVQADQSITRRYGGSGLGTAISKQLVGLMRGDIGVSSELGSGSRFWFEIPLEPVEVANEPVKFAQMRVMVLSRRPLLTEASLAALADWSVGFESVESSAGARSRLAHAAGANRPPIVLLVEYPSAEEDPLSLLGPELAAAPNSPEVAFVTAIPISAEQKTRLQAAGACAVLEAPVEPAELRKLLEVVAAPGDPIADTNVVSLALARGSREGGGAARSILVAEDNATNRMVIEQILARAGHRVVLVGDGEQLLDRLERDRFDVVIVDWNMPRLGGMDALRLYRMTEPRNERLAFIMLTANATRDAKEACEAAGFDAFLTKPVEPRRLLDAVAAIAGSQRSTEPGRRAIAAPVPPKSSLGLLDMRQIGDLRNLSGGAAFFQELVARFSADGSKIVTTMRAMIASGDVAGFREQLHALKGSAGSIGAAALYRCCTAIQQIESDRIGADGAHLVGDIDTAFKAACEALHSCAEEPVRVVK